MWFSKKNLKTFLLRVDWIASPMLQNKQLEKKIYGSKIYFEPKLLTPVFYTIFLIVRRMPQVYDACWIFGKFKSKIFFLRKILWIISLCFFFEILNFISSISHKFCEFSKFLDYFRDFWAISFSNQLSFWANFPFWLIWAN